MNGSNILRVTVGVIFSLMIITGCSSMSADQKKLLGSVTGAVVGGVIGSQFGSGTGQVVATAVGVAVGGFLGNRFAAYLNSRQQSHVKNMVNHQLNSDPDSARGKVWHDSKSNKSVEVKTSESFDKSKLTKVAKNRNIHLDEKNAHSVPENTICRYNTNTVSARNEPQAQQGTLYCRTAMGNWKPVGAKTRIADR